MIEYGVLKLIGESGGPFFMIPRYLIYLANESILIEPLGAFKLEKIWSP